ncbi:MAG: DUF6498-containing protein [Neptuniibacter sp.]
MPEACPRCYQPLKKPSAQYCPHCHALLSRYKTVQRRNPEPKFVSASMQPSSPSKFTGPFSSFVKKDKGLWSLLLANAFTLFIALYEAWELPFVMTIYAGQSIMIGIGIIVRMLNLQQFSTSGFKMNGKPVKAEPATRGKVALFFLIHYGMFHGFYLLFLGLQYEIGNLPWPSISLCILAFAGQQWLSVRDDIDEDHNRKPNIGTLMFLPYSRVIPMHLMIILGGSFSGSLLGVLLFLLLKVAADMLMYVVELYALYPKQRKLPG